MDTASRRALQQELDTAIVTFRRTLEGLVREGNGLLPELRRHSMPWYRLNFWLGAKRVIDRRLITDRIAELAEQNDVELKRLKEQQSKM